MVRRSVIPQALNGQPFETSDARAVGLSWKVLQGSRFRRVTPGVYVTATSADSPRLRVRGVMLALPTDTIATGVTGLQMLGIEVGPELPMTFASTHLRQIRRRDVRVMRFKELPPHRDGIARRTLLAGCGLHLEFAGSCYCGRLAASTTPQHSGPPAFGGPDLSRSWRRARAQGGHAGPGTSRLAAGDLASPLPCSRGTADARMQPGHRRRSGPDGPRRPGLPGVQVDH